MIRGFSQKKLIFGVINKWVDLVREGWWGLELAEEVVDLLDAPVIEIGRRLLKFGLLMQKKSFREYRLSMKFRLLITSRFTIKSKLSMICRKLINARLKIISRTLEFDENNRSFQDYRLKRDYLTDGNYLSKQNFCSILI